MADLNQAQRHHARMMDADERRAQQLQEVNLLLQQVLQTNPFYAKKLAGLELPLPSLEAFAELPFTTKSELEKAVAENAAANLTFDRDQYARVHRTSGSRGSPLYVYDTPDDWQWWIETWQYVLDAAEVTPQDMALMAFSFGPFIGFWSANDALLHRGASVIPTGGFRTEARLAIIETCQPSVLCCTPSYAMKMVQTARATEFDLRSCSINRIIVAGEPGGSIPSMRQNIEDAWSARVIDHAGASEVGPWAYGSADGCGLHICEKEFIAEFLPFDAQVDGKNVQELVLTPLGRPGWPVIRYRTGDLVVPTTSPNPTDKNIYLAGGVLSRADDMVVIRGVNIFPRSIDLILGPMSFVDDYRMIARRRGPMDELELEIKSDHENVAPLVASELQKQLGLRIEVRQQPEDFWPDLDGKAKRFWDRRQPPTDD